MIKAGSDGKILVSATGRGCRRNLRIRNATFEGHDFIGIAVGPCAVLQRRDQGFDAGINSVRRSSDDVRDTSHRSP